MSGQRAIAIGLGNNLRRCRRRAGISQEELGFRAGLHRTEIGLLERGARTPRVDTIVKLAGGLAVPASELLVGLEWAPGRIDVVAGGFEVGSGPEEPL